MLRLSGKRVGLTKKPYKTSVLLVFKIVHRVHYHLRFLLAAGAVEGSLARLFLLWLPLSTVAELLILCLSESQGHTHTHTHAHTHSKERIRVHIDFLSEHSPQD